MATQKDFTEICNEILDIYEGKIVPGLDELKRLKGEIDATQNNLNSLKNEMQATAAAVNSDKNAAAAILVEVKNKAGELNQKYNDLISNIAAARAEIQNKVNDAEGLLLSYKNELATDTAAKRAEVEALIAEAETLNTNTQTAVDETLLMINGVMADIEDIKEAVMAGAGDFVAEITEATMNAREQINEALQNASDTINEALKNADEAAGVIRGLYIKAVNEITLCTEVALKDIEELTDKSIKSLDDKATAAGEFVDGKIVEAKQEAEAANKKLNEIIDYTTAYDSDIKRMIIRTKWESAKVMSVLLDATFIKSTLIDKYEAINEIAASAGAARDEAMELTKECKHYNENIKEAAAAAEFNSFLEVIV